MKDKHLYRFENFCLDTERQILTSNDETIALPLKAVELLSLLVENRGNVLGKDFLLESLWQETFVEEASLSQNIYLLRKALGKTGDGSPFIQTHPKRGYEFVPKVETMSLEDEIIVSKITEIRARIVEEEIDDSPIEAQKEAIEISQPSAARALTAPTKSLPKIRKSLAAIALVLLLTIGGLYFQSSNMWAKSGESKQIKSITIIPFKTIGTENQEGFLGLGMADAIITRLGKTGKIFVTPTDAVRRYSEKGMDSLATARALGTESVLTGNVQRDGEHIRVTVQMVRVSDNQPLWTDRFDEKFTDIFTLQDAISQRLAESLTLRLSSDERQILTKNYTENVEAYQLYLQGRYYWAKRTPEQIQKAIACFEQAARLDPNFAQAYAGLADSYAVTASGLPEQERIPKAKAAEHALAIDGSLAEAHTSLAFILYKYEWNWLEAENHFRRAIALNPNYSNAKHWFGEFLVLMNRFNEGLAALKEAEQLDPLPLPIKADLGRALYRARRYDEAIAQSRKALELDPNYRNAYATIMYASEQKQNYGEAVEADLNYLRLSNYSLTELTELKTAFGNSGWQGYWRKELEMLKKQSGLEYVTPYLYAEIYLRLGEKEEALKMLEKSYDERGNAPLLIKVEPTFDSLRHDEKFNSLLRRAGFSD